MLFNKIDEKWKSFTPVERVIADYIKSNPKNIYKLSLDELAKELYVSKPSFVRFFKKINISGFKELKEKLFEEESFLQKNNSLGSYSTKLLNMYKYIEDNLTDRFVWNLIDDLSKYEEILFYGKGLNKGIARRLAHKFEMIKFPARQIETIDRLGKIGRKTFIFAISFTGRGKYFDKLWSLAQKNDIEVLTISENGSAIGSRVFKIPVPTNNDFPKTLEKELQLFFGLGVEFFFNLLINKIIGKDKNKWSNAILDK